MRRLYDIRDVLHLNGKKKIIVCPLPMHHHHHNTPSFSIFVSPEGIQKFRCHASCGAEGDVIDLVGYMNIPGYQRKNGEHVKRALAILSGGTQINPPQAETTKKPMLPNGLYKKYLPAGDEVLKYAASRFLTPETLKRFHFGQHCAGAELLRQMIAYNRSRLDDVLEDKHGGTADKSSFYNSSEWQQAQYLLSLASYWQGWNNYYGALLFADKTPARAELLEEAASGFTFAVLNIQEQSFVSRSILGRALCFKELKRYDKAQQDLQSVMSRASNEDPLYAQAGYERALLSYQSGNKARALQQIQQFEANG